VIQFHDFGIDIQTYTDRGKGNDFPDVSQCPHCPSRRDLSKALRVLPSEYMEGFSSYVKSER